MVSQRLNGAPCHRGTVRHHPWGFGAHYPLPSLCVVRRRRTVATAALFKVDDLPKTSTPLPRVATTPPMEGPAHHGVAYTPPPVSKWKDDELLMSGCEVHAAPMDVAVLLSGGVDSSLALQLLVAAGHRCKAFYLQIWFQEDFRNFWDSCPWEEDLKYAQQVCDHLGVTLEVVPMTSAYWDRVVASSVEEIRRGRTPNPDVLCNTRVKFGAFIDHLETLAQQEGGLGFDRVASGHYARVVRRPQHGVDAASAAERDVPLKSDDGVYLTLTPDAVKDQTYFLSHLSSAQLRRAMFPLGGLTKPQVRALASAAGLATQSRKDSQGICFLGKVKFPEFVKEHLGEWHGLIVEEDPEEGNQGQGSHGEVTHEAGEGAKSVRSSRSTDGNNKGGAVVVAARFGERRVLGVHSGYWFYTVGQRGGIKLPGGPWYVVRKDCDLNIVYVSRRYYDPTGRGNRRDAFTTGPLSWLSDARPNLDPSIPLYCKVRHGPHAYQCQLRPLPAVGCTATAVDKQWDMGVLAVIDGSDQGLAAGQWAVLYQSGMCLGAAQIDGCVDVEQGFDGLDAKGLAVTLSYEGVVHAEEVCGQQT